MLKGHPTSLQAVCIASFCGFPIKPGRQTLLNLVGCMAPVIISNNEGCQWTTKRLAHSCALEGSCICQSMHSFFVTLRLLALKAFALSHPPPPAYLNLVSAPHHHASTGLLGFFQLHFVMIFPGGSYPKQVWEMKGGKVWISVSPQPHPVPFPLPLAPHTL